MHAALKSVKKIRGRGAEAGYSPAGVRLDRRPYCGDKKGGTTVKGKDAELGHPK
jgi:hypothetical protein